MFRMIKIFFNAVLLVLAIIGFNAIGGDATIYFEGCTFDKSNHSYDGLNLYCNANLIDCTYNFRTGKTNFIDMEGTGKTLNIENCTAKLDGEVVDIAAYVGGGKLAQNTVIINGIDVALTREALQAKLDAATGATTITLGRDITGDVTVTQKPDVKITIDGNGKTYAGVITVDGKSSRYESAALTIQNVTFNAESLSADAFIRLGHVDAARYTNNVTVKDCTFSSTGEKIVAVKSYTGGDWNVTLDNLTVNQGMHSLAQLKNVEKGLKIVDCKVYSKNGVNVNNSCSMEMEGCTFDVKGYAVRFGADNPVYDETFTIKNSTLKSACAEAGDAVLEFRGGAVSSTLTLINTTITGTTEMKGNTSATIINKQ